MTQHQNLCTHLFQILQNNKEKIIETWKNNILALPDNPTLVRMRTEQLQEQITGLFESLLVAFQKDNELEIHRRELREAKQFLQDISELRAKQGFTPTETAMFVFSLKDALLPVLQESFAHDREQLTRAVISIYQMIDKLGLVTFESFVATREKVIRDQSRNLVELAESANRSKSFFLASMSHEIRTPIHVISGIGSLLADSRLDERQHEYVATINQACEGLLGLINDILDLSKIEAGQFELEHAPLALRSLFAETVGILALRAKDKNLRLDWQVDDDVPTTILGDQDRLRQILLNLLGNAIKFTDNGEIRIHAARKGQELLVSVTDNGGGIPQERLEIIFSPYVQIDSGQGRKKGGTGLGLTICRQLVEKMGGRIWVESTLGKGSTFQFTLPIDAITPMPPAEAKPEHRTEDWPSRSEDRAARILLAEDEPANRMILKAFLKNTPWRIDAVKDGSEAFLQFTRERYDLVLLDVEMPVMDGYTAARAIRNWEQNNGQPRTPIMALTAHAMRDHRERSLEAGCDHHLTKPIRKERLIQEIREILLPTTS
ncbi:MAG: response regulator [Magnetococcales bacterium]|nr:response regulator [Magnetococcales bacterium]